MAGLPRQMTNLTPEDLNQVMKFAQFLEMAYQADAETGGDDDRTVPERRGTGS